MSPTPDALSLLRNHDFQIMLREQIRCEMDTYHHRRMRKYKAAGFMIGVFCAFTLAITLSGVLIDVSTHWLFGR